MNIFKVLLIAMWFLEMVLRIRAIGQPRTPAPITRDEVAIALVINAILIAGALYWL